MGAINLGGVMDALAAAAPAAAGYRKFAYPVGTIEPPAVVVGYPEDIDFDVTFKRGADFAVFPIWYIVGNVTEKAARDALTAVIAGATGIKEAIDVVSSQYIQVANVATCKPETVTIGAIQYLSARFSVEVTT